MKGLLTFALLLMSAAVSPAVQAQDMDEPATGEIRGILLTSAIKAVFLAAPLSAAVAAQTTPQSTDNLCFHAHPAPACRAFTVTDFGWLVGLTKTESTWRPWLHSPGSLIRAHRAISDLGVMRNIGPRDAIGVSWFFTFSTDALSTGPTVRYRRWLNGRQSLDLAVGTPIAEASDMGSVESGVPALGSILGLAKYNPVPWFGVAVRPEVLRRTACAVPARNCAVRTVSTPGALVGIELSESPGATMSVIVWGLAGLLGIALSGAH